MQNGTVPWRCLAPSDAVSFIIGKGGQNIRQISETTGATVAISKEGETPETLQDKIVFLNGFEDQKDKACRMIISKLRQLQGVSDHEPGVFVIIVPATSAPVIIGSQGAQIRSIMEQSGAEINVGRENVLGMQDQPISINGTQDQVALAVGKLNGVIQNMADRGNLKDSDFRYPPAEASSLKPLSDATLDAGLEPSPQVSTMSFGPTSAASNTSAAHGLGGIGGSNLGAKPGPAGGDVTSFGPQSSNTTSSGPSNSTSFGGQPGLGGPGPGVTSFGGGQAATTSLAPVQSGTSFGANSQSGLHSFSPCGPSTGGQPTGTNFSTTSSCMRFGPGGQTGGQSATTSFGPGGQTGGHNATTSFVSGGQNGVHNATSFGPGGQTGGQSAPTSFGPCGQAGQQSGTTSFGAGGQTGGQSATTSFGPGQSNGDQTFPQGVSSCMSFGPGHCSGQNGHSGQSGSNFGTGGQTGVTSFGPGQSSDQSLAPGLGMSFSPTGPSNVGHQPEAGPGKIAGVMSFAPGASGGAGFGQPSQCGSQTGFGQNPTFGSNTPSSFAMNNGGMMGMGGMGMGGTGMGGMGMGGMGVNGMGIHGMGMMGNAMGHGMGMGAGMNGGMMVSERALLLAMQTSGMNSSQLSLLLPQAFVQNVLLPRGFLAEIAQRCGSKIDLGQEVPPGMRQVTFAGSMVANSMATLWLQELAGMFQGMS